MPMSINKPKLLWGSKRISQRALRWRRAALRERRPIRHALRKLHRMRAPIAEFVMQNMRTANAMTQAQVQTCALHTQMHTCALQ
eukprot:8740485-Alexandrium_andersonii.AAC.1